jgi:nucleoside-triphosphatase THEP1
VESDEFKNKTDPYQKHQHLKRIKMEKNIYCSKDCYKNKKQFVICVRKPSLNNFGVVIQDFRMYTFIEKLSHLFFLCNVAGDGDRSFEEVLFEDMPQKLHFDLERDFHEIFNDEEAQKQIEWLHKFTTGEFLEVLDKFSKYFFGFLGNFHFIPKVCFASSIQKRKFSAHIIVNLVNEEGEHLVFLNRKHLRFVAGLLAFFFDLEAQKSMKFNEFFYFVSEKITWKTVVDFKIYTDGQRNFRMVNSGKIAKNTRKGDSYKNNRNLKPFTLWNKYKNTNTEGIEYYLVSALFLEQDKLIGIDLSENQEIFNIVRNFSQRNAERKRKKQRYIDYNITWENYSLSIRKRGRENSENQKSVASFICTEIQELYKKGSRKSKQDKIEIKRFEEFVKVGEKLISCLQAFLHPGQHWSFQITNTEELVKVNTNTFLLPGHRTDTLKKLCFFGCDKGTHQAVICLLQDLKVTYFCHGCKKKTVLYDFCETFLSHQKERIRSNLFGKYNNLNIENVKYTTEDRFMKSMLPDPETGSFLQNQRTFVLQGGMGTGKSTVIKRLVDDINKEKGKKNTRILSISFRIVLSDKASSELGLKCYRSVPREEINQENKLAIQLDSLLKLRVPSMFNDEEYSLPEPYDVIILDEIESIFSHFSSDTLVNHVSAIFHDFTKLVRECKVLVLADADIHERSMLLISRVRSHVPVIYHKNSFVAIKTNYVQITDRDYFKLLLIKMLKSGKRVFFFSNNKRYLNELYKDILEEIKNSDNVEEACKILTGNRVMKITGDSSEAVKRAVKNCNEDWVKLIFLGITPTVGAGVDFVQEHFDVSFGYASANSCCARAFNQMRGRVRKVKESKCYFYVENEMKKESKFDLEEVPYQEILDDEIIRKVNSTDPLLRAIMTLNNNEKTMSRHNYVGEFLKVVLKFVPYEERQKLFQIDTTTVTKKDVAANVQRKIEVYKERINKMVCQPTIEFKTYWELQEAQNKGDNEKSRELENKITNEAIEKNPHFLEIDVKDLLVRNQIVHEYSINRDLEETDMQEVLRILDSAGEKVDKFVELFLIPNSSLKRYQETYGSYQSKTYQKLGSSRLTNYEGTLVADRQVTQEEEVFNATEMVYKNPYHQQLFLFQALYLCGATCISELCDNSLDVILQQRVIKEFLTGKLRFCSYARNIRCGENERWFETTYKEFLDRFNLVDNSDNANNAALITKLVKTVLHQMFGIQTKQLKTCEKTSLFYKTDTPTAMELEREQSEGLEQLKDEFLNSQTCDLNTNHVDGNEMEIDEHKCALTMLFSEKVRIGRLSEATFLRLQTFLGKMEKLKNKLSPQKVCEYEMKNEAFKNLKLTICFNTFISKYSDIHPPNILPKEEHNFLYHHNEIKEESIYIENLTRKEEQYRKVGFGDKNKKKRQEKEKNDKLKEVLFGTIDELENFSIHSVDSAKYYKLLNTTEEQLQEILDKIHEKRMNLQKN